MKKTVSRREIIAMLQKWQRGEIDAAAVQKWADSRYPAEGYDVDDWEGEESVAKEVLAHLDNLDMNLVTAHDIPAFIEFLNTPAGQFQSGYDRWQKYEKAISVEQRRKKLRKDPLYKPFCK